jgi:hypothetical protein
MVRVHSKVIMVDPLGKHPVVITGSQSGTKGQRRLIW